jgi:hypothetical protein
VRSVNFLLKVTKNCVCLLLVFVCIEKVNGRPNRDLVNALPQWRYKTRLIVELVLIGR